MIRAGRSGLALAVALGLAACGGSVKPTAAPAARTGPRGARDPINPRASKEFEGAMRAMRVGGPEAQETARTRLRAAVAHLRSW